MYKINELSVFLPAYNEEANIENTINKVVPILKKITKKWEVIIVDDGSKDKTGQIADSLSKKNSLIQVIHHPQNRGYGEALKSGYYGAKYEWICGLDADGQFDFKEIEKLIAKINEADLIISYRVNRQDSWVRKLNGLGWTMLANLLLEINVKDVDSSFRLVKKEVINKIPHLESTRGGMISPELLARAKKADFRIAQVGVHHYPRGGGRQTGADWRVIFKSFIDLGKLWWQLK